MEFVQANELSAKKKRQIKAISSNNSFSRTAGIVALFAERWRDFLEERKSMTFGEAKPGAEEAEAKRARFRLFYVTQGYILCLIVLDFMTNVAVILFSLRAIWELISNVLKLSITDIFVLNWMLRITDALDARVSLARFFQTKIPEFTSFLGGGLFAILLPLLAIMVVYAISVLLGKSIKNSLMNLLY
jgi:hypothetical protein